MIELSGVTARDDRGPDGRAWGALADASGAFAAGIHVVLGAPSDGTVALVDVIAGRLRPRRGQVTVDGAKPATSPSIRRRLGALLADPELPDVGTVGDLAAVFSHDLQGVGDLSPRPITTLSRADARRVELALALATPEPVAVVLFEPGDAGNVRDLAPRLRGIADAGAVVLLVLAELAGAEAWADHVHILSQGRLVVFEPTLGWPRTAPAWITVVLDEPASARRLAEALASDPRVTSLAWDASVVSLQAPDPSAAARAIAEKVSILQLPVHVLQASPPSRQTLLLAAHRLHEQSLHAPPTPVSVSDSGSDSGSDSDSVSDSGSDSGSVSDSVSDSGSVSDSVSDSVSGSVSDSDSGSVSDSDSDSDSVSGSENDREVL